MRAVALERHSQFSKCERGSQTPERAGSCHSGNLSHADRLDLNAAFPDLRSRSLNQRSVSENVPGRNPCRLRLHANTRRVGVAAFSGKLLGSKLVPAKWRSLLPHTRLAARDLRRVTHTVGPVIFLGCLVKTLSSHSLQEQMDKNQK